MNVSQSFHHIDYIEGKCNFDPCMIFEDVSGYKIHTENNDDDFLYAESVPDDYFAKKEKSFIQMVNRKIKISRILNEETNTLRCS